MTDDPTNEGSPEWKKLTIKQRMFVQTYFDNGFNATRAAITAGYSKKTAKDIACENLAKPNIKAAIAAEMNTRGLSPDRLMREIARIAFADDTLAMEEWLTGHRTMAELVNSGDLSGGVVQSMSLTDKGRKITMYSKLAALEQLVKIQGLIIDRTDINARVENVAPVYHPTNEQLEIDAAKRNGPK